MSNSMKLSHARGATQDRPVMVARFDRMWSTGEGNGKPLQYSCLENPMNSMKRQNDRILKEELPRSVGAQSATGDQWRNNSRKNEGMESKQKQYPAVDVTGDRSKVQYFGHLMQRADSFERPSTWEKLKAGGEGDDRG